MKWISHFGFFLVLALFITGCTKPGIAPEHVVLAKVGPRIITIDDFIRRAEYSIRPDYCRQSNYIHKKIVLNSLIAEKLTALAVEKLGDSPDKVQYQAYLTGRREQAMRQRFYADTFYSQTNIAEKEIQSSYSLSGRKIRVNFINLPDEQTAIKIGHLLQSGIAIDSIYGSLWEGTVPEKEISWFDRDQEEIHQALFTKDQQKGNVLGPIRTEDDTYVIMTVNGWIDQPAITAEDQKQRYEDVKERIMETKAKKAYLSWVAGIMTGKSFELNPRVFQTYAERAANHYIQTDSARQSALNQALWEQPMVMDQPKTVPGQGKPELKEEMTLFSYEGEEWNIERFHTLLKKHPLVFRKRKMSRSEFPAQLRLAIADLLRDEEITKECYRSGIGDHWSIGLNAELWQDAYFSMQFLDRFQKTGSGHTQEQRLDMLNPIIDSLQAVYSDQIEIDMDAFEAIELTATDMMVTQRGVPYPVMVPSFPILTTDSRLDYGSKKD